MRVISCFVIAALQRHALSTSSVEGVCSDESQATCKRNHDGSAEDPEVSSMMQVKRYASEGSSTDETVVTEGDDDDDSMEDEEFSDEEEDLVDGDDDDESSDEEEESVKEDGEKNRAEFTEKCCSCTSGEVFFSRSGNCDKCHGNVKKTRRVGKKCRASNEGFKGDQWCNHKCESRMKLHWPHTREKCCKCEDGKVGYSMDGGCHEFCHGDVQKQRNVVGKCKADNHEFKGENWCHAKCQDKMKSLLDFDTTEKCCECKHGGIGWSANGECEFCFGAVEKMKNVPRKCKVTSDNFKGEHWCNERCEQKLGKPSE